MFNPNSAFPRQTIYVPQAYGYGLPRAVNAPNYAASGAAGVGGLPSTAAAYAAIVNRGVSAAGGAPGAQRGVAAIAQRQNGLIDQLHSYTGQRSGLQRENAKRRQARAGKPALPEATDIAEAAADVVSSKKTPLSAPVSEGGLWTPVDSYPGTSRRVETRGPSFNQRVGSPTGPKRTFPY